MQSKSFSENRIELFTKLIKEGPTYTCIIWSRYVYQKGTKKFGQSKYKCPFDIINLKVNIGVNMYICLTCYGHLKKRSKPPHATCNNLDIISPQEVLSNLEKVLVYRRILFKKS